MWNDWGTDQEHEGDIPSPDMSRVAVDDPYEVRRWCQRFVCTQALLKRAVEKVGDDPAAVRAQLLLWR